MTPEDQLLLKNKHIRYLLLTTPLILGGFNQGTFSPRGW
jgi:hypothetical protein